MVDRLGRPRLESRKAVTRLVQAARAHRSLDHVGQCVSGDELVADVRAGIGDHGKVLEGLAPAPVAEVEHGEHVGGPGRARGQPVRNGELAHLGGSSASFLVVAADGRGEGEDAQRPRGCVGGPELAGKAKSLARDERRFVEALRQMVLHRAHAQSLHEQPELPARPGKRGRPVDQRCEAVVVPEEERSEADREDVFRVVGRGRPGERLVERGHAVARIASPRPCKRAESPGDGHGLVVSACGGDL